MQLGIGSYTYVWWSGVPGCAQPDELLNAHQLLDLAASLEVQIVQIADNMPLDCLSPGELDDVGSHARSLGIQLEAGTRGIQPAHLREYLRICERVGARLLRTMIDTPGHQPAAHEAICLLRETVRDFESAGVVLAIENHDRFHATALREIVEQSHGLSIGICLDTANSLGCGESIDTVLARVADMVVNLHVKDFVARRPPHNKGFIIEGTPAGEGLLDIPFILKYVMRCGRDFNVILEQWPAPEATAEESVAKERRWAEQGIRFLRPLIAELPLTVGV
jgi:sugar phosphate isomerase/epimerase